MAEFMVKTDLAPVTTLVIEANWDEIKTELAAKVAAYEKMVVTPEGISAAKSDLAALRRVSKQIDEARLAWKREYMKPMDEFEAKCKELKTVVSGGIENLDGQIKGFEKQEQENKLRELESFFDEHMTADLDGYVDFEKIRAMNPKWVNKGYDIKAAQNDILMAISHVQNGIQALRGYPEEFRTALLDAFKERLDLADVMQKYARLMEIRANEMRREQERKKAEEQRKEAEAAQSREGAAETTQEPEREFTRPERKETETASWLNEAAVIEAPSVKRVEFWVEITPEQGKALGAWLKSNGIRYGSVKR
jgi:hypothetical protein